MVLLTHNISLITVVTSNSSDYMQHANECTIKLMYLTAIRYKTSKQTRYLV